MPSTTTYRPGARVVERALQGGALGLGARGQRRDAADRVVAADEVGELLRRRRPAAADVGVVRLDRRRACDGVPYAISDARRPRRAVTHGTSRVRSCTCSTIAGEHAGIGLGLHAVAEVEDVAGVAAVVGEHRVGRRRARPSRPASTSAGSRLPCTTSVGAEPAAGVVDRRAPVEPEHVGPAACIGRAGGRSRCRSGCRAPPGWRAASSANTRRRVGQHEAVVVGAGQRAGPRVEQLERLGPGGRAGRRSNVDGDRRPAGRSARATAPRRCASAPWCARRCATGRPSIR